MPESFLLDTDVLIDFLRGGDEAVRFVNDNVPRMQDSITFAVELSMQVSYLLRKPGHSAPVFNRGKKTILNCD
jgi:hypothetical protein